jgi:NADPH:quinone reductase-like Zn-dependent oxidoreductase
LVVVRNKAFSINYADICIRWGLYESALRYVGWPIIPGFDLAGVIGSDGATFRSLMSV